MNPGDEFTIDYPFYEADDIWVPGVENRWVTPEDDAAFADAIGSSTFTVVSVHKPGRFQTRVFYVQSFVDPDEREFGGQKLKVISLGGFRRRVKGFQIKYRLESAEVTR